MKFLTQEQFIQMWKMQDSLNSATTGPNWYEKNQNWNLAIKAEVMEFFDYIGWKWWKEPDKTKSCRDMQARLELVDIWHFLLSHIIQNSISKQAESCYQDLYYNLSEYGDDLEPDTNELLFLDSVVLSNYTKVEKLDSVLRACDWTWNDLYIAYIGKNVLNKFRQDNGYKEGTYQKEWYGKEDNVHLEAAVALLVIEGIFSPEELYDHLQDLYNSYLCSLK